MGGLALCCWSACLVGFRDGHSPRLSGFASRPVPSCRVSCAECNTLQFSAESPPLLDCGRPDWRTQGTTVASKRSRQIDSTSEVGRCLVGSPQSTRGRYFCWRLLFASAACHGKLAKHGCSDRTGDGWFLSPAYGSYHRKICSQIETSARSLLKPNPTAPFPATPSD